MRKKPRVAFVCVQNSCRSQMAEGFAKAFAKGAVDVYSAGSKPGWSIDPDAVAVMLEKGVDISAQTTKSVADLPRGAWDVIVTMGCGDACPNLDARQRLDWDLPDPKKMPMVKFREVRDEIERRVKDLVERLVVPA